MTVGRMHCFKNKSLFEEEEIKTNCSKFFHKVDKIHFEGYPTNHPIKCQAQILIDRIKFCSSSCRSSEPPIGSTLRRSTGRRLWQVCSPFYRIASTNRRGFTITCCRWYSWENQLFAIHLSDSYRPLIAGYKKQKSKHLLSCDKLLKDL